MAESFTPEPPYAPAPYGAAQGGSLTAAIVIYALYLVALFTGGLSMILGVVLAYVFRGGAGPVARSHYTFQVRTFWGGGVLIVLGLLLVGVGVPLLIVLIGVPIMVIGFVIAGSAHLWQVVRCAVGLYYAANGRPYPEPLTPLI